MKKTILLLILSTVFGINAIAQNDFKEVADSGQFLQLLVEKNKDLKSIESTFTQNKHLSILTNDIVSEGQFYYKAPNKVCMEYTKPVKYLMVLNNDKMKIEADGKINMFELGSNKMMKEMQTMITSCLTGNLQSMQDAYTLSYFENKSEYQVIIVPKNKTTQGIISQIQIYLNKTNFSVNRIRLMESGNDYTEYLFQAQKFNTNLPDEKFALR